MSSDEKVVADPAATIPRKVMTLRGPKLVQDFQAVVQGYIGRRGGRGGIAHQVLLSSSDVSAASVLR